MLQGALRASWLVEPAHARPAVRQGLLLHLVGARERGGARHDALAAPRRVPHRVPAPQHGGRRAAPQPAAAQLPALQDGRPGGQAARQGHLPRAGAQQPAGALPLLPRAHQGAPARVLGRAPLPAAGDAQGAADDRPQGARLPAGGAQAERDRPAAARRHPGAHLLPRAREQGPDAALPQARAGRAPGRPGCLPPPWRSTRRPSPPTAT